MFRQFDRLSSRDAFVRQFDISRISNAGGFVWAAAICMSACVCLWTATPASAQGTEQEGGQEQLVRDPANTDSAAVRRSGNTETSSDTYSTSSPDLPSDTAETQTTGNGQGGDDSYQGTSGGITVPAGPPPDENGVRDVSERRVVVRRGGSRDGFFGGIRAPRFDGFFSGTPYVAGNVAFVGVFEMELAGTGAVAPGLSPKVEVDPGFGFGGSVGWHFDNNFRAEIEASYFSAKFDALERIGGTVSADGDVSAIAGMVNLAYDFRLAERWYPHIGGGIGIARIDSELNTIGGAATGFATSADTLFAYQFILGLGFAVTPQLMVTGDYRYFSTTDPDFGAYEGELDAHKLTGGVRWRF
jgi:opacity protein-like surface antigen